MTVSVDWFVAGAEKVLVQPSLRNAKLAVTVTVADRIS